MKKYNSFKKLSTYEKEVLLKYPVYISLLAANSIKLDETEIRAVIKLVQTKSFSSDTLLADYFKEVCESFENNIDQLDKELSRNSDKREEAIKIEILNIEKILLKLNEKYASAMQHSMEIIKDHVLKAHNNMVDDFILSFPLPVL